MAGEQVWVPHKRAIKVVVSRASNTEYQVSGLENVHGAYSESPAFQALFWTLRWPDGVRRLNPWPQEPQRSARSRFVQLQPPAAGPNTWDAGENRVRGFAVRDGRGASRSSRRARHPEANRGASIGSRT